MNLLPGVRSWRLNLYVVAAATAAVLNGMFRVCAQWSRHILRKESRSAFGNDECQGTLMAIVGSIPDITLEPAQGVSEPSVREEPC
jgi:hypothetical protein